MKLLSIAFLLALSLQGAVTITITYPATNQAMSGIAHTEGTVSTNTGTITGVDTRVDGGAWTAVNVIGTVWFNAGFYTYLDLSPGSHTFEARGTDSMGNSTIVGPVTFTTFITVQDCSDTVVTASVRCVTSAQTGVVTAPTTTLVGSINAAATTITVASSADALATPFPAYFCPDSGCTGLGPNTDERINVTNVSGTTWTIQRGQGGTTAVSHSGAPVVYRHDQGCLNANFPLGPGNTWVSTNTWSASQVMPAGYHAGDTIIAMVSMLNRGHPFANGDVINSAGYTWTFWGNQSSDWTDCDYVQNGLFYAVAPVDRLSTDTITVTSNNALIMFLGVTVYSGLGGISGTGISATGWSAYGSNYCSPNPSDNVTPCGPNRSGDFTVGVGDIVIAFGWGAPTRPQTGTGQTWNPRNVNLGHRFLMQTDWVATTTTANAKFEQNPEGFTSIVVAFSTGGPPASGKSITLSSQTVSNGSIPAIAKNAACTLEWSMHGWGSPTTGQHPGEPQACDLSSYWVVGGASPSLSIYSLHETGPAAHQIPFTGKNLVTIRYQRIPATATTGVDLAQAWDEFGTRFYNESIAYTNITAGSAANGVILGGTTAALSTAYMRIFASNFDEDAKPPTTAQNQTGMSFQWKFDLGNNVGSLNDSTGNGYTAALSGGSPTYADTPYQTLVVAIARTCNAPDWSLWISMEVGGTNCLDATRSYSQASASDIVTPTWSNVSGPATPSFVSQGSLTTDVTGVSAFGSYVFGMEAEDADGRIAEVELTVGAVDYDEHGVVQQSNTQVTEVLGPMIAFGQNPWGYMDERNIYMILSQYENRATKYPHVWTTYGTGTVSYPFAGKGNGVGPACTTVGVAGVANATTLTIPVTDATCLSLSALPTIILIGSGSTQEAIRICSTTGTTGTQTLTACWGGRGLSSDYYGTGLQITAAASAHASGVRVGEMKVTGSSTLFITDSSRPMCPAGAPGPLGPITYNEGTVAFTGSSTTVTGTETLWSQSAGTTNTNVVFLTDASGNTVATYYLRASPTHSTGTAGTFWARVVSVNTVAQTLVLDHALPSDVDSGDWSYSIVGAMYLSLGFANPHGGGNTNFLQYGIACESETKLYAVAGHDVAALNASTQTSQKITYKLDIGAASNFATQFYGLGLAARNFYYRSGYGPALDLANWYDDYWINDPQIASGYGLASPLYTGGSVIGAYANVILNASALPTFYNLVQAAEAAESFFTTHQNTCNDTTSGPYDTRDQGYLQSWLTLGASYDDVTGNQATWLTSLGSAGGGAGVLGRDQNCKHSDNSWALGVTLGATSGTVVTLTNNSVTVSGTGFTADMCHGVASGTITVTNGSASATLITGALGTLATNFNIVIRDTTSSPNYVGFLQFTFSGSAVTLAGLWPGASGTFNFVVQSVQIGGAYDGYGGMTILYLDGLDSDNVRLQEAWACTFVSLTELTLNRPWNNAVVGSGSDHASGSYRFYTSFTAGVGPAGYYQQPYMLGIKTYAMRLAQNATPNATINAGYAALAPLAGAWMASTGYDTYTKGLYYARVTLGCEPTGVPNMSTLFDSIYGATATTPCGYSGLAGTLGGGLGEFTERVNSAEAWHAFIAYYKYQCSLGTSQCDTARDFVDEVYGAVFGDCALTEGAGATYYCDSHFVNTSGELSDTAMETYKWPGFFFGIGMAHMWPAVRWEGIQVEGVSGLIRGKTLKRGKTLRR